MHNVPPEEDFESSRSPANSEVFETVPICTVKQYDPNDQELDAVGMTLVDK